MVTGDRTSSVLVTIGNAFTALVLLIGVVVLLTSMVRPRRVADAKESQKPWHEYPILDEVFSQPHNGTWVLPTEGASIPASLVGLAISHYTGIENIQYVRPDEPITKDLRMDRIRLHVTEDGTTLESLQIRIG